MTSSCARTSSSSSCGSRSGKRWGISRSASKPRRPVRPARSARRRPRRRSRSRKRFHTTPVALLGQHEGAVEVEDDAGGSPDHVEQLGRRRATCPRGSQLQAHRAAASQRDDRARPASVRPASTARRDPTAPPASPAATRSPSATSSSNPSPLSWTVSMPRCTSTPRPSSVEHDERVRVQLHDRPGDGRHGGAAASALGVDRHARARPSPRRRPGRAPRRASIAPPRPPGRAPSSVIPSGPRCRWPSVSASGPTTTCTHAGPTRIDAVGAGRLQGRLVDERLVGAPRSAAGSAHGSDLDDVVRRRPAPRRSAPPWWPCPPSSPSADVRTPLVVISARAPRWPVRARSPSG